MQANACDHCRHQSPIDRLCDLRLCRGPSTPCEFISRGVDSTHSRPGCLFCDCDPTPIGHTSVSQQLLTLAILVLDHDNVAIRYEQDPESMPGQVVAPATLGAWINNPAPAQAVAAVLPLPGLSL